MTTERDKYGIPHPSDPMPTFAKPMTPEQEEDAASEAEAEAELFLSQEEDYDQT